MDKIRSTWFDGTDEQWFALDSTERETLAFNATGCEVAYPTWGRNSMTGCCHPSCMVRRGEKPESYITECVIDGERFNGWLRFMSEEDFVALRTSLLAVCAERGIVNPWQIPGGWRVMVGAAL